MNNRVLIVDDSQAIHDDFQKILPRPSHSEELDDLLAQVIDDSADEAEESDERQSAAGGGTVFDLDHAYQGLEAVEKVASAVAEGHPYSLVFTDVRMPPGINGVETVKRMWKSDPELEVVIVTAYSDHSWREILEQLGSTEQLQFVRKPFDTTTIKQMTLALTKKWTLRRQVLRHVDNLESEVSRRTKDLNDKVRELETALKEIRQLQGILPMCVYCHKIRTDAEYWQRVDEYIRSHSAAEVSHGICPDCYVQHVQPQLDQMDSERRDVGAAS